MKFTRRNFLSLLGLAPAALLPPLALPEAVTRKAFAPFAVESCKGTTPAGRARWTLEDGRHALPPGTKIEIRGAKLVNGWYEIKAEFAPLPLYLSRPDASYEELRDFLADDVARYSRVPEELIGDEHFDLTISSDGFVAVPATGLPLE